MQGKRKKYRLFYRLEEHLEIPMFLLALLWLYFFIIEIVKGISPVQEKLVTVIWAIFVLEFLLKLFLAPRRRTYVKKNWITVIALIIPALRVFRLFSAIRLLSSVRVINSTKAIRALTSGRRFFSALKQAQGPQPEPEMNIGFLLAYAKKENEAALQSFSENLAQDVKEELSKSTGLQWCFEVTEAVQLESDDARRASDFLDVASLKMVEGPYDLVCVVTDVPLMSRRNRMEPGLISSIARVAVISTRELVKTGRNQSSLDLEEGKVRKSTSVLFLHLMGHLLGLEHSSYAQSKIMGTTGISGDVEKIPSFNEEERKRLRRRAPKAPERELRGGNLLESFIFHILMTLRHPSKFLIPLFRNWSIFLALSLPGLATAAFAPAILLVFTAEIWDVGLGMSNATAAFFAVLSIMFGSFYLVRVQSLFLPRKNNQILTEHLALTNSVIYFSIFLACIGLFIMVAVFIMVIEIYVFPEGLMRTWPTLDQPEVSLADQIRLAVFISTVGVTTGALAGGLESRKVIQHLALFRATL